MAKYKTSKSYRTHSKALDAKVPSKFKDHNLMNVNPLDKQFEPTDANPVRQHVQMAGDPASYRDAVNAKPGKSKESKSTTQPRTYGGVRG